MSISVNTSVNEPAPNTAQAPNRQRSDERMMVIWFFLRSKHILLTYGPKASETRTFVDARNSTLTHINGDQINIVVNDMVSGDGFNGSIYFSDLEMIV